MATAIPGPRWRKSGRSHANGNCAEVATLPAGTVAIRDTRDRKGTVLRFSPRAWRRFTSQLKRGGLYAPADG